MAASQGLTLDDCRAYLQKPSGAEHGGTVFDHLAEVLLKLCEDRPANPVDVFEEVSAAVKQTHFNCSKAPLRPAFLEHPSSSWSRQQMDQFKLRGPGEPGACLVQDCVIQNIVRDAVLIEQAGIGLKPFEATRIALGLQRLASEHPVKSVRFWGKIVGTQRDYLVAECQFKPGYTGGEPEASLTEGAVPPEPAGTGANTFAYFVCQFGCGDCSCPSWTQLPHVRPECIMASRKICKLFTGCLESPVHSFPPFPGNEADYLRATICRIAHGATMSVDGMYSIEEDEETGAQVVRLKDTEFAKEKGEPPYEEVPTGEEGLTQPEEWVNKWVHHPLYPSLLSKMGRCVWPKKEVADGDEEPEEDEDKEEGLPLATNLAEETPISEGLPAWTVKLAAPVLKELSPAVLRSLRWPGAFCVVSGDQAVNIYIGNGQKYTGTPFQVQMPPVIPDECGDNMPPEEGSDEPGPPRPGMKEQADELLPNPFNEVDQTAENGADETEE